MRIFATSSCSLLQELEAHAVHLGNVGTVGLIAQVDGELAGSCCSSCLGYAGTTQVVNAEFRAGRKMSAASENAARHFQFNLTARRCGDAANARLLALQIRTETNHVLQRAFGRNLILA